MPRDPQGAETRVEYSVRRKRDGILLWFGPLTREAAERIALQHAHRAEVVERTVTTSEWTPIPPHAGEETKG